MHQPVTTLKYLLCIASQPIAIIPMIVILSFINLTIETTQISSPIVACQGYTSVQTVGNGPITLL